MFSVSNRKGSSAFFLFMMGIVFIVLALALAPSLTDVSSESQSELDCNNSSISNQNKAVCTQVDIAPPFYMGLLLGFAGLILWRMSG